MTSLGLECTAFALRLGACLAAVGAIFGGAMIFGLHGLTWRVVAVLLVGAFVGAVLIVLEDRVMWRARKEQLREEGGLR